VNRARFFFTQLIYLYCLTLSVSRPSLEATSTSSLFRFVLRPGPDLLGAPSQHPDSLARRHHQHSAANRYQRGTHRMGLHLGYHWSEHRQPRQTPVPPHGGLGGSHPRQHRFHRQRGALYYHWCVTALYQALNIAWGKGQAFPQRKLVPPNPAERPLRSITGSKAAGVCNVIFLWIYDGCFFR
jgi:hypothetical protein